MGRIWWTGPSAAVGVEKNSGSEPAWRLGYREQPEAAVWGTSYVPHTRQWLSHALFHFTNPHQKLAMEIVLFSVTCEARVSWRFRDLSTKAMHGQRQGSHPGTLKQHFLTSYNVWCKPQQTQELLSWGFFSLDTSRMALGISYPSSVCFLSPQHR